MTYESARRPSGVPEKTTHSLQPWRQNQQPKPLSWEEAVDEDRPLTSKEKTEARKDTVALWLMRLFVLGGSAAAVAAAIQQAAR